MITDIDFETLCRGGNSVPGELVAAAKFTGTTTMLIAVGAPIDFHRGATGTGALLVVDDVAGGGPDAFDADAIGLLEQAHGVFVLADVGDDALATMLTAATGAMVGLVLTTAGHVEAWRQIMSIVAPRTITMTAIGAPIAATVNDVGTA